MSAKEYLLASLLFFSPSLPLFVDPSPRELFKEEVLLLEQQTKKELHTIRKGDVHIKVKQLIDYDVKLYYNGREESSVAGSHLVDSWYDKVAAINKAVKEKYQRDFGICLDVISIHEWQHEKSTSLDELLVSAEFVPPGEAQIVVGITGAEDVIIAGKAEQGGNHLVVKAHNIFGKLNLLHELGHVFNADDVHDEGSIMNADETGADQWDKRSKATILANKYRSWKSDEVSMGLYALLEQWKDDSLAQTRLWRGYIYFDQNAWKDVEKELSFLLDTYPTSGHLLFLQGELLSKTKRREDAIVAYEKALTQGTAYALLQNNLSYCYLVQEQHVDHALHLARQAVAKAPNEEAYRDTLGWAYYHNGQYHEAEKELLKIKKEIDVADYHFHLGMTWDKLKKYNNAKQAFAKVIKLDTGDLRNKAQMKLDSYKQQKEKK